MGKGSQVQRLLRRIEWSIEGAVREYEILAELGDRIHTLDERLSKAHRDYNVKADECRRWFRLLVRIVDAADVASIEGADFSHVDELYDVIVEAKHVLVDELEREGGRSLGEVIELVRARMQREVGGPAGVGAAVEVS